MDLRFGIEPKFAVLQTAPLAIWVTEESLFRKKGNLFLCANDKKYWRIV